MNTTRNWIAAAMLAALPLTGLTQDNSDSSGTLSIQGTTDAETGLGTRTWLKEQAEGVNRGEVEPYHAESAGKAYRAYVDSIGAKGQQAPVSQVSTIKTN